MHEEPSFQRDSMSTIGPKGPHLFRSYSISHPTSIAHITIPHSSIVMPPTPSASASPTSPPAMASPSQFPQPPSPQHTEAPQVRPMSELSAVVSDYDLEEVKSWTPKQVCAWMVALGFDRELVEKFERNDISGAILVDLKWEDLKEVCDNRVRLYIYKLLMWR
jgi:SAM domain (Sterile alpha motif)